MDATTAKQLLDQGGLLVVTDTPVGTHFGIDCHAWQVGPRFQGVKFIPPGLHFLHWAAIDSSDAGRGRGEAAAGGDQGTTTTVGVISQGRIGPRAGIFRFFQPREVVRAHWDSTIESLVVHPPDPDEAARIRANVRDLDRFLGAYPFDENFKRWVSLTDKITEATVARVAPQGGRVHSCVAHDESLATNADRNSMDIAPDIGDIGERALGTALTDSANVSDSARKPAGATATAEGASSAAQTEREKDITRRSKVNSSVAAEQAAAVPEGKLSFTHIPRHLVPAGAVGAELSQHSRDRSYALSRLLATEWSEEGTTALLGEMQMAFVAFLLGQTYDAFEQWKKLVALLCGCDSAIEDRPSLFEEFLPVIHFQLKETPPDFFVDIVSRDNFLVKSLSNLFLGVAEAGADPNASAEVLALATRTQKFRASLQRRFDWDFGAIEADEDGPIVVEL